MRALLTIDSGLRSEEAVSLRDSLIESGLLTSMLGPEHGDLVVAGGHPDSFESVGDDPGNPIFALQGSPMSCVQAALGGGLVGDVDVVITGLHGSDTAGACTRDDCSDAAAREAALMGRPALSVVIEGASTDDIKWAGTVVADLAAWLLASPAPVMSYLKVWVPTEVGHRALKLGGSPAGTRGHDGHIRLEAVNLDTSSALAGSRLIAWAEETIATINPRLGVSDGRCLAGCCG